MFYSKACGFKVRENINSPGGVRDESATTVAECGDNCLYNPRCHAFDWNTGNARCFHLTSIQAETENSFANINHYKIICPCPPTSKYEEVYCLKHSIIAPRHLFRIVSENHE